MMSNRVLAFLSILTITSCFASPIKSNIGASKVMQSENPNGLPYDAEVEYLASSGGGEQIDLGIYHYKTNDLYAKVWAFEKINAVAYLHSECFFRATNDIYRTEFRRYGQSDSWFFTGILMYGQILCRNLPTNVVWEIHLHSDDTGEVPGTEYATINGIEYSNGYSWRTPQVSASTMVLFPYVVKGSRIYYFKIDNQISLKPVRKGRKGYMYDELSGRLYGKTSGDGEFIIGPDVPKP